MLYREKDGLVNAFPAVAGMRNEPACRQAGAKPDYRESVRRCADKISKLLLELYMKAGRAEAKSLC